MARRANSFFRAQAVDGIAAASVGRGRWPFCAVPSSFPTLRTAPAACLHKVSTRLCTSRLDAGRGAQKTVGTVYYNRRGPPGMRESTSRRGVSVSVAEIAPRGGDFERTPPHDLAAEQCVLGGQIVRRGPVELPAAGSEFGDAHDTHLPVTRTPGRAPTAVLHIRFSDRFGQSSAACGLRPIALCTGLWTACADTPLALCAGWG